MQHGLADHELPHYVYCTRLKMCVERDDASSHRGDAHQTHFVDRSVRDDSERSVFILSTLVTGVQRGTPNSTALGNQVFERNAMTEGSGIVKRISIFLESQMGWKLVS